MECADAKIHAAEHRTCWYNRFATSTRRSDPGTGDASAATLAAESHPIHSSHRRKTASRQNASNPPAITSLSATGRLT